MRGSRRKFTLAVGLSFAACVGLALACAGPPRPVRYVGDGSGPDTADGLYRVQAVRVGGVYLRPGTDFSSYDSVLIDPVTVSYSTARRAPDRRRERGNDALSETHMERLKSIFQESLEGELSKSRYAVVSEPGPAVLRVSGHILDLIVEAPTYRGKEELNFVLKSGEMTLLLNVHDSKSGAPLARVADRRAITPAGTNLTGGYRSSPVSNWTAVRDVFEDWARILRGGLDELHQLPPVPSPVPAPSGD